MNTLVKEIKVEAGLRTSEESLVGKTYAKLFDENINPTDKKLENFPKYVRRQNITRFLALYEIFKLSLNIKGSIIECGVNEGFGLMSWAKFSAILEPTNLTRRIYGFDSFEGFPEVTEMDMSSSSNHVKKGDLKSNSYEELIKLIDNYDKTRFIGHINKVNLIKGNALNSIPLFVQENPHLLISLLFLDFDLFEPTKVALDCFMPRMPKGSIIAFDELDNPLWPGETLAMLEKNIARNFSIRRFDFDPYIGYVVLD